MLTNLIIRNLALIEELAIDLSPGLNIVTGETGAGKSIVIGAVQLLLGQRAERSLIRGGAEACEVNGIFELASRPDILAAANELLAAAGAPPCEDGQLLIRRWFSEKNSRVFLNAAPVTVAVLKELGELLVDVHGPYDHQSLLRPARQLAVLDAFAGLETAAAALADGYAKLRDIRDQVAQADQESASPDLVELLRFQVREIESAKLQPEEDAELTQRHARVANASELLAIAGRCHAAIAENDGCLQDRVAELLRDIEELQRIDGEAGQRFAEALERASAELQSLTEELGDYGSQMEIDPRELSELEDRLALLQRLKRKYGGTIERVLEFAGEAAARLARLDNLEGYREQLRQQEQAAEAALREQARALSRQRKQAARRLAPLVTAKLQSLGFPDGQFAIELAERELGPTGIDAAEFHVAPNPGEGSAPLRTIASSGEIARIMLALKTVLTAADRVPLLIFDEVDANVGGVVAVTVGREMWQLGREHQIVCITHLPQIAAGGDRHFQVAKRVQGGRTVAVMEALAEEPRIAELARMLGGEGSSSVVRKHAAELIANVRKTT